MTLKDTILAYVSGLPDGATDTEIEKALGVKHHAQVNQRCRQLAASGLIERREIGTNRFRNFYIGRPSEPGAEGSTPAIPDRPWFWEGNIQAKVVRYLVMNGWDIQRVADTSSREYGKDIIAKKRGRDLWVTVKGWPRGTEHTRPATQGVTWFKNGFFDLVAWRGESKEARLLLALPDFGTYRRLSERASWLESVVGFTIGWINQAGELTLQGELEA